MGIRAVIVAALSSKKSVAELCFPQIRQLPKFLRRVSERAVVTAGALPASVKYTPSCFVNPTKMKDIAQRQVGVAPCGVNAAAAAQHR